MTLVRNDTGNCCRLPSRKHQSWLIFPPVFSGDPCYLEPDPTRMSLWSFSRNHLQTVPLTTPGPDLMPGFQLGLFTFSCLRSQRAEKTSGQEAWCHVIHVLFQHTTIIHSSLCWIPTARSHGAFAASDWTTRVDIVSGWVRSVCILRLLL